MSQIDKIRYPKKGWAIADVTVAALSADVPFSVARMGDRKVTICGDPTDVEELVRFLDTADEVQKLVRAARIARQGVRRIIDTLLAKKIVPIRDQTLAQLFKILDKRLKPFEWVSEIDPEDGVILRKE